VNVITEISMEIPEFTQFEVKGMFGRMIANAHNQKPAKQAKGETSVDDVPMVETSSLSTNEI
jgi:hypothetical protein